MKIKVDLSTKGIQDAIKQIQAYRDSLPNKCRLFVEELANVGIYTADYHTVSSLIYFGKDIKNDTNGCKTIMFGQDISKIIEQWVGEGGEVREAEVSPLLMAEFGSGRYAENTQWFQGSDSLGGRGTFPEQTHAFDENGWWWMDLGGEWHHSYGFEPTQPMYHAWLEMYSQIEQIAKKVFRS